MVGDGDLIVMGRVSGVFGIKGWLKVWSYTDPIAWILQYRVWYLRQADGWAPYKLQDGHTQGKGIVVQLEGCTDREAALGLVRADIAVKRDALPPLETDEYYWHQLQGLRVYAAAGGTGRVLLGLVDHLIETGANDVLVVKPIEGSLDQRERLIPWVPTSVVLQVDLAAREMLVDWDPEF
jgi:16S rRNA processing protein RimM